MLAANETPVVVVVVVVVVGVVGVVVVVAVPVLSLPHADNKAEIARTVQHFTNDIPNFLQFIFILPC